MRAGQPLRPEAQEMNPLRAQAAVTVADIAWRYAQHGSGLAAAALAGARRLDPLRHYPRGDVIDHAHRTGFFYHAHASARRPAAEHGHFHLFTYTRVAQQWRHTHLVALSLDAFGVPLRWFTVNDWVTGGRWRAADTLLAPLQRFEVATSGRLAPVAAWLTAMVRMYSSLIATLLHERDRLLCMPLDRSDRGVEVVTQRRIDLLRDLRQIGAGLEPATG